MNAWLRALPVVVAALLFTQAARGESPRDALGAHARTLEGANARGPESGAEQPAQSRLVPESLDVADPLRGVELGARIGVLEDKPGMLQIEQIAEPSFAARFGQSRRASPSFGYTDSAYWLRLSVANSGASERSWLLELGYPLLDYVTLYVPRSDGGYERRETGDMLPFSRRDFAYRNFVFLLDEPAHSARTYYLRVSTSGSMTLPLAAWTIKEFAEHQHLDWAGLCVFYGVILVMACYNASLYFFTRQRAYLLFTPFVLSIGLMQLTLVGHTAQFLLPNEMKLGQLILPVSIQLALYFGCVLGRYHLREDEQPEWFKRLYGYPLAYCLCAAALSLITPYHFSIRLAALSAALVGGFGCTLSVVRFRSSSPGAKLQLIAWIGLVIGVLIAALRSAGALPTNLLTLWSVQLGASFQFVLLSSGLAGELNAMRAEVDVLNRTLSGKVDSLEEALTRAREATERAEQATRVKDEFVATMSHELRTPLNAIINLPQGLLDDFPLRRYAVCGHCGSTFQLEPNEALDPRAPCPECLTEAPLVRRNVVRYAGKPERTIRYLSKIERSGKHLLQVVNDILSADQGATGSLALALVDTDVAGLLREVGEEMSDLAERAGVRLSLPSSPAEARLPVDRLRLRQVLINLIGNAIKFSDGRGSVEVGLELRRESCLFWVRDQGIGIAPENFETIFASFEQVHDGGSRKYGGTGLGLAIARSLVHMHGGQMWVESELGRGATFLFELPRTRLGDGLAGVSRGTSGSRPQPAFGARAPGAALAPSRERPNA